MAEKGQDTEGDRFFAYGQYYLLYDSAELRESETRTARSNRLFQAALQIAEWIQLSGREIKGKRFLEVGAGRSPDIPIALWLCGAHGTATVDLNAYLTEAVMAESILLSAASSRSNRKGFQRACKRRGSQGAARAAYFVLGRAGASARDG